MDQGLLRVVSYQDDVNDVNQMRDALADGLHPFEIYWLSGDKVGVFSYHWDPPRLATGQNDDGHFHAPNDIDHFLRACDAGGYHNRGIPRPPKTYDGKLTETYRLIFEGETVPIGQNFRDCIPTGAALTLVLSPTVCE